MIDWRANLSALPDVSKFNTAPEMVVRAQEPGDPTLFWDTNGTWVVVYGLQGGPYKRRMA